MKLALINLIRKEADPPLGIAYITSYLRKYANFDDTIIIDRDDPLKKIKQKKPDLVGISSLSFLFPKANKLAAQIKSQFDIRVIIGGYHISILPHHLNKSNFDIGVIGEGEQTITELVQLFERKGEFPIKDLRKIKGLVFRNERNGNELTERRPLIEPLDNIPLPARDLLSMKNFYLIPRKASFAKLGVYTAMLTSRGCPYNCVFCSPTVFWRRFRSFSPQRVVDEMELLIDQYKVDGIMIWDDLFVVPRKRLIKIVELAEERKINERTEFLVFARANLINEETVKLLQRLHVTAIDFGLESGSERILRYLKKGSVTVEDNYRALKLCKQHDMRTIGTLIIGSPEETGEDIEQTFNLIKNSNLDEAFIFQLTPLPGTEVWEYVKSLGIVSEDINWNYESISTFGFHPELVMTKHLSKEQLKRWYNKIQQEVEKKNYGARISNIKLKYLLDPRMIKKIISNWREYSRYLKQRIPS